MHAAEILTIGTEILLGEINNTNSLFLSQELAKIGINCFYHTTVGDNTARLIECIETAAKRCQLIVTTGGIGPTPDDLTIESISKAFQTECVRDADTVAKLEEFYRHRGRTMPLSNLKQADRPQGSTLLPNPSGTAPGIIWQIPAETLQAIGLLPKTDGQTRTIICFPGVPFEMKRMWQETARPFLQSKNSKSLIYSVDLIFIDIGESQLAENFTDLLDSNNPTVAPYAGNGECKLRVSTKSTSIEEAQKISQPLVQQIIKRGSPYYYGRDEDTLESVVAALLTRRKLTLSLAESCTGGLVSKRLTDIPGSSNYIKLNFVTYANEAKMAALGVSEATLAAHGAVSKQCAEQMAQGAREHSHCDIGVSITGIAGPGGGTDEKPVGLVYLGFSSKHKSFTKEIRINTRLDRSGIRHRSANACLNMIRLALLE